VRVPVELQALPQAGSIAMAQQHNQDEVGRKLSQQAWGICKKIAEVDQLLISHVARCAKSIPKSASGL
jgi:predicted RNase H-like nuclease